MRYKNEQISCSILGILIGLMCTLQAQETPSTSKQAQWEAFKAEEGSQWTIRWNENTGLPRTIHGATTEPYSGTPESMARQFLSEYKELFSMKSTLSDLRHTETQTHRGVHYVSFQQYHEGIKVQDADYVVHVRKNGRIGMATGFYYPGIEIATATSISDVMAISSAQVDLNATTSVKDESTTELVILPVGDDFKLAHKVHVRTQEPYHNAEYMIDAIDGSIINKRDKTAYFHKPESQMATGTGQVYPKHPLNSTLTTKSLFGLLGNGRLDGTYTKIKNDDSTRAYSLSNTFIYSPNNSNFDEVSLYYHIDTFRRNFIEPLDVDNELFTKIEATAHAGTSYCSKVACFQEGPFELFFPDLYPFAREDKVVYHEYTHAVMYDIESGITPENNEEGAIAEGVSDYFAGAATPANRDSSGESLGKLSFERSLVTPFYSDFSLLPKDQITGEVNAERHDGGEFFASILWDIRNHPDISHTVADELVFAALFGVSGSPDFMEFRNAMMSEDASENSAAHWYIIQDVFNDKGVGSPSAVPVTISGPVLMDEGDSETWTANIGSNSNGVPPYTYEWSRIIPGQSSGVVGTGSSYTGTQFDDFTLEVEVTDSNGKLGFEDLAVVVDEGGGGCIICKEVALPTEFTLSNNYPNPFNPSTQIKFELPEMADVSIKIYNIVGQEVATLVNDQMQAGFHNTTFEADNLASGVYIARLTAVGSSGEQFVSEIKMQLIK